MKTTSFLGEMLCWSDKRSINLEINHPTQDPNEQAVNTTHRTSTCYYNLMIQTVILINLLLNFNKCQTEQLIRISLNDLIDTMTLMDS